MLANKLTLNPAKSNVLIINPKLTSTTPKLEITCSNGSILSTTKAKYLGVIIDDKLNFSEHVKLIEFKVVRAVGILDKLNYYIPQKPLLTLCYSLIHPYLLYGLVAWGNTFPTYLDRLSKLQNKASRIIHSSNCNLSTSLLYCKLDVLPSNKLIKFEIAKFVHEQINNKLPSIAQQPKSISHVVDETTTFRVGMLSVRTSIRCSCNRLRDLTLAGLLLPCCPGLTENAGTNDLRQSKPSTFLTPVVKHGAY